MRNLPLPSRSSARDDLVKALKTYRYGGKTHGYTATSEDLEALIGIYDSYDAGAASALDELKGPAFSPELLDALYDAFDLTQEGRKLNSVRKLVFSGVTLCPVCGIGPAKELDHYLPRSVFKPLAIYARNLVPLCHDCNLIKLAGFGDQDEADKRFLHAYFDLLPDIDFLKVDVALRGGGLVVRFGVNEGATLPQGYADRLANQFTKLELNQRYEQELNTYLCSHAVSLHMHYGIGGANAVRQFLALQARYETAAFYRNHWRPTLLSGLSHHSGFTEGGFAQVLPMPVDMLDDLRACSDARSHGAALIAQW